MNIKNSHCSYCGGRFTEQKLWPRRCFICYNDSWSNPLPVVVVLLKIEKVVSDFPGGKTVTGILIQRRGIEPKKGEWALTGGYIDQGENWQQAAVREVYEELGLKTKEDSYDLYGVTSSTDNKNILIFCSNRSPYDWNGYDDPGLKDYFHSTTFIPNEEVLEVDVMWEPRELAFPAHNEMANKFIKERNK